MKQFPTDRVIVVSIVLVAALVAWLPMQLSGMIDNGDWHVHWFRLNGFSQSLLEGTWRPYWHADANSGYGAPTFLFYPPLSYYLASIPVLLGADVATAWSLAYFAICLIAASGSYRLFRQWSGKTLAACTAGLYALSPPILFKLYQIHMPASALAIALIPWLLSAVLSPSQSALAKVSTIGATSALLVLSHPMISVQAALVVAILLGYLVFDGHRQIFLQVVAGGALGLLLSAWYWLPLMLFRHLVHWEFLLNPAWLWEFNVLFARAEPPYGAFHDYRNLFDGLAVAGLLIGAASYGVILRHSDGSTRLPAVLVACLLACLFIMSPAGIWLAQAVPPIGYLMFAWRWLGIQWLIALGLLAFALEVFQHRFRLLSRSRKRLALVVPGMVATGTLAVSLAVMGFGPVSEHWGLQSDRVSEVRGAHAIRHEIWPTLEMRPKSMGENWQLDLEQDPMPFVWLRAGDLRVRSVSRTQHRIDIDYEATRTSTIRLKHLYFPSWKGRVGEDTVQIETEQGSGAMILTVPPGSKRLVLSYEGWPWLSNGSD